MNIYAFISLFSSIVVFFLGNYIYYKNPDNRLNQLIAILCFLVAYLSFAEYGLRNADNITNAIFWSKTTFIWPMLTPLLLTIVLIVTKRNKILKNKLIIILLFLPSTVISLTGLLTNQLNNGLTNAYWGWTTILNLNSPILLLTVLWIIILGLTSIILSYMYYRKSSGSEKIQITYILIGLTVVLIVSLITELILPLNSIEFPELTYFSSAFGLLFISYGVANYRLPSLTPEIAANEIVRNITNFLVITDCNKKINYVNPVGLKLLGYIKSEIYGKSVDLIFPEHNKIRSKDLQHNGYTKHFETTLNLKNNDSIPILLSASSISKKTSPIGILYMGTDIRKRKAIEQQKRSIAKQTIARQSVLLELYKEDISELEKTLKHLTETVSKTLNVDRVSVWFFNKEKTVLTCTDIYILDTDVHENGLKLIAQDYPKYINALKNSHNLTAENALTHPDTAEFKDSYLKPNGIISMMDVPIWLQGEMVGVLCHEQTKNMRKYTFEEQDFAASISYIISLSLEASERDKAQKQIIDSLEEKNVLLREIHHRVKNNMQIISSLLSLQSSTIENPEMREVFHESQNRVKSMSMIHEQLYQTDNLSKIDFKIYINGLIKSLFQIYSSSLKQIKWNVDVKDVKLNLETSIPCGLIINELISNSLKHAFKERDSGKITVKMDSYNNLITLIVADNGIGIPNNFQIENTSTLGLKLVTTLVKQLDGEMIVNKENGTSFTITFKEITYMKRE
ncbi:histidine kinase dimerization/phosphoacceptor domain -containing protein [Methanobacterium spitsbergense]|uniref:GAF domain-containing protein n=1 Tax=Methanobacterium spitsbergense TaxID=2874285 RepID=A0A8T5UYQ3_9EURY|nr:histidine kinase dimerization/phosphoacceptor domain -containing protein [Methanobacterium spitsbergense]MBZ2167056.1 GAF domain-containing protein [Methanobacterium spitsbergense]